MASASDSLPRSEPAPSPRDTHPNHHLWRNGRLWWIAFTVHRPNWTQERIRFSLGTADVEQARRRRDRVLEEYSRAQGCTLSLRFGPARREGSRCGVNRTESRAKGSAA